MKSFKGLLVPYLEKTKIICYLILFFLILFFIVEILDQKSIGVIIDKIIQYYFKEHYFDNFFVVCRSYILLFHLVFFTLSRDIKYEVMLVILTILSVFAIEKFNIYQFNKYIEDLHSIDSEENSNDLIIIKFKRKRD